jgi:hypothetical protein
MCGTLSPMHADVNLDDRERASHLRAAVVMLAMVIALMIALDALSASLPWWFTLAVPLFAISLMVTQAYTGVSTRNASRCMQTSAAGGTERVCDPARAARLANRGRAVRRSATLIAALTTAVAVTVAAVR